MTPAVFRLVIACLYDSRKSLLKRIEEKRAMGYRDSIKGGIIDVLNQEVSLIDTACVELSSIYGMDAAQVFRDMDEIRAYAHEVSGNPGCLKVDEAKTRANIYEAMPHLKPAENRD